MSCASGLLATSPRFVLLLLLQFLALRLDLGALFVADLGATHDRADRLGFRLRQLDQIITLEEIADHGRCRGFTGDRGCEHQLGHRQAVLVDQAGQDLAELVARRMVGILAEFGDAFGETGIGQDQGDALQRAVETTTGRGLAQLRRVGLATDEFVDRFAVFVGKLFERSREFGIGCVGERAVEQAECLEASLDVIHVVRRYLTTTRRPHRGPPTADTHRNRHDTGVVQACGLECL